MTRRGADPAVAAGERGSATVWVVALAGLLAAVGMATVLVGAAVVGRHRAGAAADLAALAGAGRAVLGDPAACAVATAVAVANGAAMDSCRVGADAVVEVHVRVPVRLGPLGTVSAGGRARAGPAAPVAHGGTPTGIRLDPTPTTAAARTPRTSAGDLGSGPVRHYRATPSGARRPGAPDDRPSHPAPASAWTSSAPTCDRSS
ncbi:Rv3654c family TadE-like protein [Modestobacter sp. URMC 112]